MSQPEMQPDEAPRRKRAHEEGDEDRRGLGALRRRPGEYRRGPGDLRPLPFPVGDWGEPAQRLDGLYRWAEARALRTADWYLRDRVWKRRGARALRLAAVVFAAVGAGLPLVALTGSLGGDGEWGFVALLAAAACVGADRYFGLTSGWMRDVSTAQAVQRRLEAFQFEWAAESVREVLGPTEGTASEAAERCLGVLRRFCEDVSELVRSETSEWILEFRSSLVQLQTQASAAWETRPEVGPAPARAQLLPGSRASMPRQRPPEPPR
ncbi:SLATT domain-containing protein [Streptomyces capparidis]